MEESPILYTSYMNMYNVHVYTFMVYMYMYIHLWCTYVHVHQDTCSEVNLYMYVKVQTSAVTLAEYLYSQALERENSQSVVTMALESLQLPALHSFPDLHCSDVL